MTTQVQIRDAQSAANAYATIAKFGVPTKFPADAVELKMRLRRTSGRGRELAVALQTFVDAKGFSPFAEAVERSLKNQAPSVVKDRSSDNIVIRTEAEAAAVSGSRTFTEIGDDGLIFSASGLY